MKEAGFNLTACPPVFLVFPDIFSFPLWASQALPLFLSLEIVCFSYSDSASLAHTEAILTCHFTHKPFIHSSYTFLYPQG